MSSEGHGLEGGTWPGSPQERAAKPFLVWGEWRAREAGVYVQGTWAPGWQG